VSGSKSISTELLPCANCGWPHPELERDNTVFARQDYSDRYPTGVATQSHGYRRRCPDCGMQTCWWHYASEADAAWHRRPVLGHAAPTKVCHWTEEGNDMALWKGSCGVEWFFPEGTPDENGMHYCPHCGGVALYPNKDIGGGSAVQ